MKAPPTEATLAQIRAADPRNSTWLTANAGSGKTRVLTDRVARLLLDGVDPQNILCLTYTKAAASEMQNRLFKRLGGWAMLDEALLQEALEDLGEPGRKSKSDIDQARTLFARAIETPGGLKIQTIHSFCAGLLRRFPLEAGVNPQFQEIEDRAAELLRSDVLDKMARGSDAALFKELAQVFTGDKLSDLTAGIVRQQESLSPPASWSEIAHSFKIPETLSNEDISRMLFVGSEQQMLDELIPALHASASKPDKAMGLALSSIKTLDHTALPILKAALLTQKGTPKKQNPTKAVRSLISASEPLFDAFLERICEVESHLKVRKAAERTYVLRKFANRFLDLYTNEKLVRGWLDFDDLILKSRRLLRDPTVAQWVLFRLDGGISHILVDEAQDTSPAQWDVIEKLTQDFTSGEGSHEEPRTLFVVGDKKQSIYSFQGADPDAFNQMHSEFGTRLRDIGQPLASRSLEFSFRSSDAILRLVDATFRGKERAGFEADQLHRAFHADKPGRVDLWSLIEKVDHKEDRHWTDPVDRVPQTHHDIVLARQVADQISDMLDPENPEMLPETDPDNGGFVLRPVQAGDIMILVQRRSRLFHEIIKACKQRDIPVAGSDRLRVGAELAVRDLLALLSFLVTPEDDLSLACVLRSPLFGWSEKELFDLAQPRKKGVWLWEALRATNAENTLRVLHDLRNKTDFLRPYDLIERVLTRHDGRKKLLSRLGTEAEDGIDALLSQALSYERSEIPGLPGFLNWAKSDDLEIKRQIDSSGNLVRIMTVHGAKGLESPIVVLPDCAKREIRIRDDVLDTSFGPVWKPKADEMPDNIKAELEHRKDIEARERLRLLYVALTRAESWLIVAAAGEHDKNGDDWHQLVETGMQHVGASEWQSPSGKGMQYLFGNWDLPRLAATEPTAQTTDLLDQVFQTPADQPSTGPKSLSPSDLGGAKALPSEHGLDENFAKARGTYVHNLIEQLSQPGASHKTSQIPVPDLLDDVAVQGCLVEARDVVEAPDLLWIFDTGTLPEVSVTGTVEGTRFFGIIDRLIITENTVTIVDFKTNTEVPGNPEGCPEGILRQMGAYRELVQAIYPDRTINTGILWTSTKSYMSVPQNLVTAAFARATLLDVESAAS